MLTRNKVILKMKRLVVKTTNAHIQKNPRRTTALDRPVAETIGGGVKALSLSTNFHPGPVVILNTNIHKQSSARIMAP